MLNEADNVAATKWYVMTELCLDGVCGRLLKEVFDEFSSDINLRFTPKYPAPD